MLARLLARYFPAPVPHHQTARRLKVEALEDRLTLNSRFVVPLSLPADGVSTFHSLSAALTTAGLSAGDTVQVEQFSTPGGIANADVDAVNATGVTVRGAPGFAAYELPEVRTVDAITVDTEERGLVFRNMNLRIDHTFSLNTDAVIADSNVVIGATGGNGLVLNNCMAAALRNNTLINTGVPDTNSVIQVQATAGSNNRVEHNTIISTVRFGAMLSYSGSASVNDVVAHNTFLGSDAYESNSSMVRVGRTDGLVIRGNVFRDATAAGTAIELNGAVKARVEWNTIELGGVGTKPTGVLARWGSFPGWPYVYYSPFDATLQGNQISTGQDGTAVSLNMLVPNYSVGGESSARLVGNDFGDNKIGVGIANLATASQVSLGGTGANDPGGNNFRSFRQAATAMSGAIVVSPHIYGPGITGTVQARQNLFGVSSPEDVVYDAQDDATLSDVVTTGALAGNAAFVQSLYLTFHGRVGDVNNPADAGAWVSQLDAGTSPAVVANAIARSPEALGLVVDDLFRTILGREADPVGRAHHIALLAGGVSIEAVQIGLYAGAEYRDRFPGDAAFIASLYEDTLGRSPQGGVPGWQAVLPSVGRGGVAAGFLLSREYRTRQVQGLYVDLFKRTAATAPTAAEVGFWVDSGLDLLSLQVAFASTPEYFLNG